MRTGRIFLLSLLMAIAFAGCQLVGRDPLFRLTLRVVDEEGKPVEGAKAGFGAVSKQATADKGSRSVGVDGLTDVQGIFSGEVEALDATQAGYEVSKPGHYPAWASYRAHYPPVRGKWQPWNPTIEVVLKRIKNPVPMYAKWMRQGLEIMNSPYAYDLQAGDWVAPHGKGTTADFIFTRTLTQRGPDDYDYELKVTFSNPGDGIQRFPADPSLGKEGYQTRVLYKAPIDGYTYEWTLKRQRRPKTGESTTFDIHSGYFFRVRTVLDKEGKVVKALYGKIYGDFFDMTYCLNPDGTRNIEFDPKRNLLKPAKPRDRNLYEVGP